MIRPEIPWTFASKLARWLEMPSNVVLYGPLIFFAEFAKTVPIECAFELIRCAMESTLFANSANALFGDLIAFEISKLNAFFNPELTFEPKDVRSPFIAPNTLLTSLDKRMKPFRIGSGNFAPILEAIR